MGSQIRIPKGLPFGAGLGWREVQPEKGLTVQPVRERLDSGHSKNIILASWFT